MKKSELRNLIREEIRSVIKEWGGGMISQQDIDAAEKASQMDSRWKARQKKSFMSRGGVEIGDIVGYKGKQYVIMTINDDDTVNISITNDPRPTRKVPDSEYYIPEVPLSELDPNFKL